MRSGLPLRFSIGRNPDREEKFQWVGVIAPVKMYFFKLRGRDDIAIDTLKKTDGTYQAILDRYRSGK